MRRNALLFLSVLVTEPALASSIERLATKPPGNPQSLVALGCTGCTGPVETNPPSPSIERLGLPRNGQILRITDRQGQKALERTEAWMGGSPVTFVSLNPLFIHEEERLMALRKAPALPANGDGVDAGTTAALSDGGAGAHPAKATTTELAPDFSTYRLRPGR